MKKAILLLLCSVLLTSCGGPEEPAVPYREGAVVLKVDGMHCSACEGSIMTELSQLEGLEWARAENELGEVAYTGPVPRSKVAEAIEKAGFEVGASPNGQN